MKLAPLIALRPPQMILRFPRAKLPEVLRRLGYDIGEEFELDSAQWFACLWGLVKLMDV